MDISYLLLLQRFREVTGGALNGVMELATKLGDAAILTLILALLYWLWDKKEGVFLMLTFYGNRVLNGFVKITACVYRPWIRDPRVLPVPAAQAEATGYSFPSGHSANAISVWGGMAARKRYAKWLRVVLVILVLVISFSRNYLGVHTPQDVVVSLVVGVGMIALAQWLLELVERRPELDVWVLVGGVALCALLVLYAALKPYPMDYDEAGKLIVDPAKMAVDSYKNAGRGLGFFLGWFLERRVIRFSTDVGLAPKAGRLVVGVGLYELLEKWAAPALSAAIGGGLGKTAEQFVLVFYIVALAPALFLLTDRLLGERKKEEAK